MDPGQGQGERGSAERLRGFEGGQDLLLERKESAQGSSRAHIQSREWHGSQVTWHPSFVGPPLASRARAEGPGKRIGRGHDELVFTSTACAGVKAPTGSRKALSGSRLEKGPHKITGEDWTLTRSVCTGRPCPDLPQIPGPPQDPQSEVGQIPDQHYTWYQLRSPLHI